MRSARNLGWWANTPDVAAGVIIDARERQRRRSLGAAAILAVLATAALVALDGPGGLGPGASNHAAPGGHTVRAGALTVTLPAGWHWRIEHGCYRNCTIHPITRLDLASYRLPAWFGQHEGPTVVPAGGVLLVIDSVRIRSSATPWKRWRLSNGALRPARRNSPLDPNRYRAEVSLPRSAAITGAAWLGSIPMPTTVLAAANGVLRSIRVDPKLSRRDIARRS